MGRRSRRRRRHSLPVLPSQPVPAMSKSAQMTQVVTQRITTGPLPEPETLARYEQVQPGAADRIIRMAEQQAEHRRGIEKTVVNGNVAREKWGQMIGAGLYILTVGAGTWLIAHGFSTGGLTTIISASAGAVGVFIVGKTQRSKDLEAKRES
jgi:uncharacterized membrane protein